MSKSVVIFGANGRFGRAAVRAFADAGWRVRAVSRSGATPVPAGVEQVAADATHAASLAAAASGCDVIVNALNAPYPCWGRLVPVFTANVIAAARATGATVMIPGNVYNYGEDMPPLLTEQTPQRAGTKKGRIRIAMEQAFRNASSGGVQAIVLRAGDFLERETSGNWFDAQIAAKADKGRVMYPGPLDAAHAWAYLPDMARAMVGLAEKRAELAAFEEFGFAGFALTGRQLVDAMERVLGRRLRVTRMPWIAVRVMGFFNPLMREVYEMAYLWRVPHAIDGGRLASVLPDFRGTSVDAAIADALSECIRAASGAPSPASI